MSGAQIPGGYILLSRKLINSSIMNKPPLYLKVWLWLLLEAQHSEYRGLKRGQVFVNIPDLVKAMSYKVGYRTESPTKRQIQCVLDWLRNPDDGNANGTMNEPMIVTTKVTRGLLVTIVKYDYYQDSENYERSNESNNDSNTTVKRTLRQRSTINKNDKECNKNDKKDIIYNILEHWNSKKIVVHNKGTKKFQSILQRLNTLLKDFSVDEIKLAIDRYDQMLKDQSYVYCSYIWSLDDFLGREKGFTAFLDDGSKWINYLRHKEKKVGGAVVNGPDRQDSSRDNESNKNYSKFKYDPEKGIDESGVF